MTPSHSHASTCTWIVRVEFRVKGRKQHRYEPCGAPATEVSCVDRMPLCIAHFAVDFADANAAFDAGYAEGLGKPAEGSTCARCGAVLTLTHVADLCEACYLKDPNWKGGDA
jgi:hypothetical protein